MGSVARTSFVRGAALGRWISAEEAKELTVGKAEFWNAAEAEIKGRTVELKQHDPTGPRDKPVWLWEDGEKSEMYLGEWKVDGPKGYPVMHGLGILYNNSEDFKVPGLHWQLERWQETCHRKACRKVILARVFSNLDEQQFSPVRNH